MKTEQIAVRKACLEDAELIYPWRNDESVRRHFFQPQALSLESHLDWFKATLTNEARHLLIASKDNMPVGVLRFDDAGDCLEVDVYLNPAVHGQGYGAKILEAGTEWVRQNLPGSKRLLARVIAENAASLKVFEKAGYSRSQVIFEKAL